MVYFQKETIRNLFGPGAYSFKVVKDGPQFEYTVPLHQTNASRSAWLRLRAWYMFTTMEWNEWKMARLVMRFERNGTVMKETSIRLQWLTNPWQWHEASFEFPLKKAFPALQPGDEVDVIIGNWEGVHPIFVDHIKLELID